MINPDPKLHQAVINLDPKLHQAVINPDPKLHQAVINLGPQVLKVSYSLEVIENTLSTTTLVPPPKFRLLAIGIYYQVSPSKVIAWFFHTHLIIAYHSVVRSA